MEALMALTTISTSFIEEFESGVHVAYQRMGSKLRNTVRTRNGVKNKTTFQKIGKGFATTKARHGNIAPMNLEHTNVNVTVEDYFAGEWLNPGTTHLDPKGAVAPMVVTVREHEDQYNGLKAQSGH